MISLDGDKKSHDINRRSKTGKGSFDIILENLSRLKAYNEEYYSKVLFNCVISSSSDLENISILFGRRAVWSRDSEFQLCKSSWFKRWDIVAHNTKKFQSTST